MKLVEHYGPAVSHFTVGLARFYFARSDPPFLNSLKPADQVKASFRGEICAYRSRFAYQKQSELNFGTFVIYQ